MWQDGCFRFMFGIQDEQKGVFKKILWWSRTGDIVDDPTGWEGKEKFDNLKFTSQDKYGNPSLNSQTIGLKLFKEYDEFYECLAYKGCGSWVSCFNTETKDICLELSGLKRGKGYLWISIEAVPEWKNALDKYKQLKDKSDADALWKRFGILTKAWKYS